MVAKTIGFNWGPAGTACGRWTGVRLADVLRACGMRGAEQGARYVCFRGPKNELPQGMDPPLHCFLLAAVGAGNEEALFDCLRRGRLPPTAHRDALGRDVKEWNAIDYTGKDGSYGTSVERYKALDPASDIILAWRQNGRLLTPDHGYPLRIIIPGAPRWAFPLALLASAVALWVRARASSHCFCWSTLGACQASSMSAWLALMTPEACMAAAPLAAAGYIGGRMVKWLEEVSVTAGESDNFYHFHDNRVLPSHVTSALAKEEGAPPAGRRLPMRLLQSIPDGLQHSPCQRPASSRTLRPAAHGVLQHIASCSMLLSTHMGWNPVQ